MESERVVLAAEQDIIDIADESLGSRDSLSAELDPRTAKNSLVTITREEEFTLITDLKAWYLRCLDSLSRDPETLRAVVCLDDLIQRKVVSLGHIVPLKKKESTAEKKETTAEKEESNADIKKFANRLNECRIAIKKLDDAQLKLSEDGDSVSEQERLSNYRQAQERCLQLFNEFKFLPAVVDVLVPKYLDNIRRGNQHIAEVSDAYCEILDRRDLLYSSHEGYLKYIVGYIIDDSNLNIPPSDGNQAAQPALLTALHKFDPDRGNLFRTYLKWWIQQAVRSYAYANTVVIVPANVHKKAAVAKKNARQIDQDEMSPDDFTLVGMGEANSIALARQAIGAVYFDDAGPKTGSTRYDLISDPVAINPYDAAVKSESHWVVSEVLELMKDILTPRELTIMERLYGIGSKTGCKEETLKSIGEDLDISIERVRQLKVRSLEKLRKALRIRLPAVLDLFAESE